MKLETYLRMAGLQFEIPAASVRAIGGAPKGKLPYIEDAGRTAADSTLVIDYLKATYGDPLDGWPITWATSRARWMPRCTPLSPT